MQALETEIYGDKYGVMASWENAASPILQGSCDEWESTQYQVADFRHDADEALKTIMAESLSYGGEVNMDEVCEAVENAKWV